MVKDKRKIKENCQYNNFYLYEIKKDTLLGMQVAICNIIHIYV